MSVKAPSFFVGGIVVMRSRNRREETGEVIAIDAQLSSQVIGAGNRDSRHPLRLLLRKESCRIWDVFLYVSQDG